MKLDSDQSDQNKLLWNILKKIQKDSGNREEITHTRNENQRMLFIQKNSAKENTEKNCQLYQIRVKVKRKLTNNNKTAQSNKLHHILLSYFL